MKVIFTTSKGNRAVVFVSGVCELGPRPTFDVTLRNVNGVHFDIIEFASESGRRKFMRMVAINDTVDATELQSESDPIDATEFQNAKVTYFSEHNSRFSSWSIAIDDGHKLPPNLNASSIACSNSEDVHRRDEVVALLARMMSGKMAGVCLDFVDRGHTCFIREDTVAKTSLVSAGFNSFGHPGAGSFEDADEANKAFRAYDRWVKDGRPYGCGAEEGP